MRPFTRLAFPFFPLFRARFSKKTVSVKTGSNLIVLKTLTLDRVRYVRNLAVEAF